jgi:beta-galactosidase
MATVTYDGQSLLIDGRRIWILAAAIEYARTPESLWAQRIAAARQAGFNTIQTSCPWLVHEPRPKRFRFDGDAGVRRFIELCSAAGMRVIVKTGPFVGEGYDGGGLPAWLLDVPGLVVRERNEPFLERVSLYYRKLLAEFSDLQATDGGPIILVQCEHAWLCANEDHAKDYLSELARALRENGIGVPITNANDLWSSDGRTIDTWRGSSDLLANLRQLRTIQPNAPRLVSAFQVAQHATWGQRASRSAKSGDASSQAQPGPVIASRLAEILAAGGQPVVWPFHGGTNFGFLAGRLSGDAARYVCTSGIAGAVLGEAGERGDRYHAIRPLVSFAGSFAHVFAELDPDFQPPTLDLATPPAAPGKTSDSGGGIAIVPVSGAQGRVIFVFDLNRLRSSTSSPSRKSPASRTSAAPRSISLLLENGVRMPVALGQLPVSWFVFDVDLLGSGRLDYATIPPVTLIDSTMLVLAGPANYTGYVSINGSATAIQVPTGLKPEIVEHKGITVCVFNEAHLPQVYWTDKQLYVGVTGLDPDGHPIPSGSSTRVLSISPAGRIEQIDAAAAHSRSTSKGTSAASRARVRSGGSAPAIREWRAASAASFAAGQSPRFASLAGPQPLSTSGASSGYGWYRVEIKASSSRKRTCAIPFIADRAHLFLNGRRLGILGFGPGANLRPLSLKFDSGRNILVALVDNLGRFANGSDMADIKGLFGHIYDVRPIRAGRPKKVTAKVVDPFDLRNYIAMRTYGQLSDAAQLAWTFSQPKKNPVLIDVQNCAATGTFVLNDKPVAYHSGSTGSLHSRILLEPGKTESMKRGRNILRFAPDPQQDKPLEQMARSAALFDCIETLSQDAAWSFARWEAPPATSFHATTKSQAHSVVGRGQPCWWHAEFEIDSAETPLWLDTSGLSKGQVYLNEHNIGRYFTATGEGRDIGPQRRLYLPAPWLRLGEANDITIFDEHGFDPFQSRLVFSATGDMD